jgi:hypothetical protein
MTATRDPTGISSIGIQSIMPTMGTSRRVTRRNPDHDRNTGDASSQSNDAPPLSPPPAGTGRLVDKAV